MNELKIFENEAFGQIRAMEKDGEPWFVAADVCRALEIGNPTDAIKRLDEDEKARLNLGLSGGDTNIVNEPGLYALVLGSRNPNHGHAQGPRNLPAAADITGGQI